MKKTRTTVGLIVCNEEAYKRNTAWRRISSNETAAPDRTGALDEWLGFTAASTEEAAAGHDIKHMSTLRS